ncbi:MAG: glycosyltransferase family 4 protein [Syntrophaceae bacterium]|nr:glycosyltransferase family 4 protein [Syntrophaceae bacterium]
MPNSRRFFLIGPFPPPVHGMSMVNVVIRQQIGRHGVEPIVLNTSPKKLDRAWYARILRAPKVLLGLSKFFLSGFSKRPSTVYMSISGGYGQVYEILFLILARILRSRIFLHHHNYTYLDKRSEITRTLMHIAGQEAIHIVLCSDMAERVRHWYGRSKKVFVLSNAALSDSDILPTQPKRSSMKKVGFLGNISDAKGIFEFLEVMKYIAKDHPNLGVSGFIAGPFEDHSVDLGVMTLLSELPHVFYVGSKYGEEKVGFLREIDALLFPSKYEAEPFTIHEAMAYGLPVIASERGCIGEIISSQSGLVIKQQEDFVKNAAEQLLAWASNRAEYVCASKNAYNQFIRLSGEHKKKLGLLLHEMTQAL